MAEPLNLETANAEMLAAMALDGHNQELAQQQACVRWVKQYAATLVCAAEAGYSLSRIAACSERRNQPQFLKGLFEAVAQLQMLVTDDRTYMRREVPEVFDA